MDETAESLVPTAFLRDAVVVSVQLQPDRIRQMTDNRTLFMPLLLTRPPEGGTTNYLIPR